MAILTEMEYHDRTGGQDMSAPGVQTALDVYTAIIEKYCHRTFGASSYTDTLFDVQFEPVVLKHAPINSITSITVNDVEESDPDAFNRDDEKGFVFHNGAWIGAKVEVVYNAGYAAPEDVKHVLQTLVSGYLSGVTGGLNAVNQVASETVYGVSSVKYNTGTFDVTTGGHAELGPFTTLLDPHVALSETIG
jgi:hypothetical protein